MTDIREFVRKLRRAADAIDDLYEVPTRTKPSNETPEIAKQILRQGKSKNGKRGHRMIQALQIIKWNGPVHAASIAKQMKLKTSANVYAILERLVEQKKIHKARDGRYTVVAS